VVVAAAVLGACSSDPEPRAATPSSSPAAPAPSGPPTTTAPETTAAPQATEPALPPVTDPVSLARLMREEVDGGRPRVVRTIERTATWTRDEVTYRSGDTTVSGVLLRPRGPGPFPGIVLNHGYIEPSVYVTGQGLAREQVALVEAGFVVLHTDYRGHAASDPAGELERETRLGYVRDAANAVDALTKLPSVDPERLAMLGRSMGGGVTQGVLVTHPGLVDAAVVYASVSSSYVDNLRQFTEPSRPGAVDALTSRFGTPREAPDFYAGLSTRTFFDRITEPVLALHGSVDGTCPPRWARTTQRLMRQAGVDSRLVVYPGEDHAFYDRWQDSMDETIRFLRARLRA
jgi:dipeptidyl aminopeptidase/acylaminoacyl peptidase